MIDEALDLPEVRAALSGPVRELEREEVEVLDYKPPKRRGELSPKPFFMDRWPSRRSNRRDADELR